MLPRTLTNREAPLPNPNLPNPNTHTPLAPPNPMLPIVPIVPSAARGEGRGGGGGVGVGVGGGGGGGGGRERSLYSLTPLYASHALSLTLLLLHLHYPPSHPSSSSLPYLLIFFPLWLADVFSYFIRGKEVAHVFSSSTSSYAKKCKTLFPFVDLLGSNITRVLLFCYLSNHLFAITRLYLVFAPLWVTTIFSIILRCGQLSSSRRSRRSHGKNLVVVMSGCFINLLLRVALPLLISLKLDALIHPLPWVIVALPLWILIFFGMACSSVLIHCSSFIHVQSHPIIRTQAVRLMLLCALQLFIICTSTLISSIWLIQKLNYDQTGHGFAWRITYDQILVPLIVMFVALMILYPMTLYHSMQYNELASLHPPPEHAGETQTLLKHHTKKTWLQQISDSIFIRVSPECFGYATDDQFMEFYEGILTLQASRRVGYKSIDETTSFTPDHDDDIEMSLSIPLSGEEEEKQPCDDSCGDSRGESGFASQVLDSFHYDGNQGEMLISHPSYQMISPCFVCCEASPDCCIMECGHGGICYSCAKTIALKQPALCPICRTSIAELLHFTRPSVSMDEAEEIVIQLSEEGCSVTQNVARNGTSGS